MATNPTTMWTPQGGYLDPANYYQGGQVAYLDENGNPVKSPLNPNQFATPGTATGIAGNLGGTTSGDQLSGPGMSYIDASGKPITQQQVNLPGQSPMNAGLVAQDFGKYGSSPGSYGRYEIAGQGAAPAGETYAQYAQSQPGFQMNPTLGNSGPGYNFAWDPNTKTYTNTATGQKGITQAQATQQERTANGVNPSTLGISPQSSGVRAASTAGQLTPGTPKFGGGVNPGPVATGTSAIPGQTPGDTSAGGVPAGGDMGGINPGVRSPGHATNPGGSLNPDSQTPGATGITPLNFSSNAPPGSTPPIGTTSGPQGPTDQGFAPTGNAAQVAPNAQYLGTAGNGNPMSYLQYNDPTKGPFAGQYQPYTGTHIDEMAQNNRNLALGEGAGLEGELQDYTNYNAGQSGNFQQQLASAYAPIASGQGGYTNEQMQAILNEPALQALQQTPGQAQQNFLTQDEQNSISGDPYAAYRQLGLDEQSIDQSTQSRNDAVNGALRGQTGAVNGALSTTAGQIGGTLGEFNQNYNFGAADEQAIREQAGRTVGNQELSDEDRLSQQANQQGNTSPLALQAARDRMRQTGAVNSANAMSDAAIKAKQLALQTTATRESTQQGAEQYLGNQQQQAQQFLGTANTSNAQTLGAAGTAAEEYKTGTNLGAGQTAEKAASDRAAGIATNRQTTEQGNQNTQLQRGQYIYGQNNSTNTGFANQTLQQQQEYRNYLQTQQTQANQNQTIGNQQKINTYGTQIGGANSATNGAIANYGAKPGDPTLPTNLLGIAKGGAFTGPQEALVGEAGPELILDFSGPDYSAQNGGSRPRHMAGGGLTGLPGLNDYGSGNDYGFSQPQAQDSGGGWPQATPAQAQQASAAQAPRPGDLVSQGPTGAGAIKPKNNSLWNSIVAGLGAASGSQSGGAGGGAANGGNILTSLGQAVNLYKTLNPGSGGDAGSGDQTYFAKGGLVMAGGGTVAPVTQAPPQWPDVDASVGGAPAPEDYLMGGGSSPVKRPGGGNPPPSTPLPPPAPPAPGVTPPAPPLGIGQTHSYIPPEGPPGAPSMQVGYKPPTRPPGPETPTPPPVAPPLPPHGPAFGVTSGFKPFPYPLGEGPSGEPPVDPSHTIDVGAPPPGGEGTGSGAPPVPPPLPPHGPAFGVTTGFKPYPYELGHGPSGESPPAAPPIGVGSGGGTGLGGGGGGIGLPGGGFSGGFPPEGPPSTAPPGTVDSGMTPVGGPGAPWTQPPDDGGGPGDPNYTPGSGYGPGSLGPPSPGEPGTLPISLPGDNDPGNIGGGGPWGLGGSVPGGGSGGSGERGDDSFDDYARGGLIAPTGGHPFGAKGRSKSGGIGGRIGAMLGAAPKAAMPHVSLVTKPTITTLGAHGASAVIPLVKRKANRLGVEDIPSLISKFSGPAYGA